VRPAVVFLPDTALLVPGAAGRDDPGAALREEAVGLLREAARALPPAGPVLVVAPGRSARTLRHPVATGLGAAGLPPRPDDARQPAHAPRADVPASVALTLLRAAGAALGLLVLCLALRPGPRRLRVTARELPLLVGYGLTGFFLVPMLYFVAIARLPVGIALLFEYTAPLFVALWARFGQSQRVRPRL